MNWSASPICPATFDEPLFAPAGSVPVESSVNGQPWETVYSGNTSSTTNQSNSVLRIGAWAGNVTYDFEGAIDEVHFVTSTTDAVGRRSNDWIKAEYDNQASGSTFLTVGSEEAL